ncbi:MAG: orotidine-5'-phosphate decarboxylase [Acidimicrobiia bacterium]|nr:orotidine-5'-phosphate decarboxylase [Acidimicrobiia bacterium]
MTELAGPPLDRARCALALDTGDLARALGLARILRPWFGIAKVGLELFGAVGPAAVGALRDEGFEVFVDLKLHDIPNTVAGAARSLAGLGARYVTMHAAGGSAMLTAGADGLAAAARPAGAEAPVGLAITVLTSDSVATGEVLASRAEMAAATGCGGVVCAAADLPTIREAAGDLLRVVAGIRPRGAAADDQSRVATPAGAVAAGADIVVIGRPVTAAADPAAAASALLAG